MLLCKSTLRLLDKLGENYDAKVHSWRERLEQELVDGQASSKCVHTCTCIVLTMLLLSYIRVHSAVWTLVHVLQLTHCQLLTLQDSHLHQQFTQIPLKLITISLEMAPFLFVHLVQAHLTYTQKKVTLVVLTRLILHHRQVSQVTIQKTPLDRNYQLATQRVTPTAVLPLSQIGCLPHVQLTS